MDPVCMLTIYPQLLRNFVYKMPNFMRMNSLLGFVDSLRFVFSRDLMVAEVSSRHLPTSKEVHDNEQSDAPRQLAESFSALRYT